MDDDAVFRALADASRRQLLDRMHARNGRRKRDGNTEKLRQIQRLPKQAIQELPARVHKHQHRAAILTHNGQRPSRPFRSKFVL